MNPFSVIHLSIGELVLAGEDHVVSTILGSCVSVCLYSPRHKMGGIIHYALARKPKEVKGDSPEALRYGDAAIQLLVENLCEQTGEKPKDLTAKIAGGASGLSDGRHQVGPENVRVAESMLQKYGIRIVGRDVGGNRGRKILYHTGTARLQVALLDSETSIEPMANPFLETPAKPKTFGQSSAPKAKPAVVTPVAKAAKSEASDKRKRRVLVVDDSKTIRDLLTKVLNATNDLEVVGTAENPLIAEPMIERLKPDVLTLDVHMPEMDGITFLSRLLPRKQIPVVMITSISMQEGDTVLRALELGAVDYIQKPNLKDLPALTPIIQEKVREASFAKVRLQRGGQAPSRPKKTASFEGYDTGTILAIGASTGGTEAIKDVLTQLPAEIPPTVIVQHIPPVFSTAFANRLDTLCPFDVKEAEDGDVLRPGLVLIAPGGKQMAIRPSGGKLKVVVNDDAPMNRHKPSVDYLFYSVAQHLGPKAVGVILTGMGNDGAKGLLEMRNKGARTIGQDEPSSVVYGMPKAAYEIGAVEEVHSLMKVPDAILKNIKRKSAA